MNNEKEIDIPFGAFDSELYYQEIYIPDGFKATIEDNKIILKRKESEDEKISREITEFILTHRIDEPNDIEDTNSWLAWLEKQGEQSSNILHEVNEEPEEQREIFCEWESSDAIWHDVAFYHADTKTFWNGEQKIENVVKWAYIDEMLGKQGEQKPVWSEEDTFKVQRICKYLDEAKKYYADITEVRECMDWLKSLKQRIEG